MKKIILFAVLFCLTFAVPASAAHFYVTGYVDENGESCEAQESCKTKIDYLLADAILVGNCMTDNVSDRSVSSWVLVMVACVDPSDYLDLPRNDSLIDVLPRVPFDIKMSAMASAAKNGMGATMTKYGITGNCDAEESYRLSILCMGQQIIPSWTEVTWSYF